MSLEPRRRGAASVHAGEVRLGGHAVRYALHRVPRRRHVHIIVSPEGGIEVRAPWHVGRREAEALLAEHAAWVVEALDEAHRRERARPRLVSGAWLPLLDERLRLDVDVEAQIDLFAAPRVPARSDPGAVHRHGSVLRVTAPAAGEPAVRGLLEGWYRREARRRLPPRALELAEALGVRPARVVVRGQRTRWGSCSDRGTVSLNWRLLLVPSALADYILVHELCHLRHMNHSPAFWAMVARLVPDYRARRARLDATQDSLAL